MHAKAFEITQAIDKDFTGRIPITTRSSAQASREAISNLALRSKGVPIFVQDLFYGIKELNFGYQKVYRGQEM